MDIKGKIVLVTGANGGIGGALVGALLDKGVAKVYAAARSADAVTELAHSGDPRVVAVRLDVTDSSSVAGVAELCRDVDMVINNAGVNRCVGFMVSDAIEQARVEMEVNYFGTLAMCRAFAPILASRGGGAIVNVCSIIGLVNLPVNGTYCASKAAGHSLLQGLRAELAPRGIRVIGVYPGPVDTKMTAGQEMPKTTPEQVAAAILAGVEKGDEYIFPDPMSQHVHAMLEKDSRQVEKEFGTMV
ncbi:SDR family oxidoreductase [Geobacter benzoatilyticus]|uniref:SDR family oxidoreductase n=1 Tax=Geobacter benzoatilyticus TaxID=2815309 RepID=A0ABX7Q6U5_9BACT|nr:SDR family oxidoreductase [Geobacter benzoatilyticus]QSV47089.1 SDR family oxidoreductase [Geobacter benzoatilyticus]